MNDPVTVQCSARTPWALAFMYPNSIEHLHCTRADPPKQPAKSNILGMSPI